MKRMLRGKDSTRTKIVFIILTMILVSCTPAVIPISTKLSASETVAPSKTHTRTPEVIATSTPRPTATRTFVPTYTPASLSSHSASYRLRKWTAEQADLLIDQISSNLDAIAGEPIFQGVYGWSYYIEQFNYLAFVENEALLRFPTAPQAKGWRWDVCYNLALSYPYAESTDAPELECYAKLIEDGLNSGQTNLSNLSNWFSARESRFSFSLASFDPPRDDTTSYVISLEDNAILFLLEKSGEFQVTGLRSSMFFFRESGVSVEQLDLTGDGYPELILNFGRSYCCGAFTQQFVYELSSGDAKLLSFKNLNGTYNHIGSEYDSYITPIESEMEPPGLIFKGHYGYDPLTQPCNLRKYDKYYWNGYQFEWADTWFGIDESSQYNDQELCQFVMDTAQEEDELNVAVKSIGDIRTDEPNVTKDQILYRLGEYHARIGNLNKAKEFFTQAIASQTTSNKSHSKWGQEAQIFLDDYQEQSDYYEICARIAECNMHSALQQLIDEIRLDSFLLVPELLKASGIFVKSNGVVNFDANTNTEQWLVVQHPNRNTREFWILVEGSEKIDGLFVSNISTNKPELKEFQGSNIYELTTSNGKTLISLEKLRFTNQPYILTHDLIDNYDPVIEDEYLRSSFVEESLDHITSLLLSGTDPAYIRDLLVQFSQSKSVDCKESDVCDKIHYLLGLTSELLGDDQAAVQAYVQLWQEFPGSLYTIMARSKLEPVP